MVYIFCLPEQSETEGYGFRKDSVVLIDIFKICSEISVVDSCVCEKKDEQNTGFVATTTVFLLVCL